MKRALEFALFEDYHIGTEDEEPNPYYRAYAVKNREELIRAVAQYLKLNTDAPIAIEGYASAQSASVLNATSIGFGGPRPELGTRSTVAEIASYSDKSEGVDVLIGKLPGEVTRALLEEGVAPTSPCWGIENREYNDIILKSEQQADVVRQELSSARSQSHFEAVLDHLEKHPIVNKVIVIAGYNHIFDIRRLVEGRKYDCDKLEIILSDVYKLLDSCICQTSAAAELRIEARSYMKCIDYHGGVNLLQYLLEETDHCIQIEIYSPDENILSPIGEAQYESLDKSSLVQKNIHICPDYRGWGIPETLLPLVARETKKTVKSNTIDSKENSDETLWRGRRVPAHALFFFTRGHAPGSSTRSTPISSRKCLSWLITSTVPRYAAMACVSSPMF